MNIPSFNYKEYTICNNCSSELRESKIHYLKHCLHKLCDQCFRIQRSNGYHCKKCDNKPNEDINDILIEPQDETNFKNDKKYRREFFMTDKNFLIIDDFPNEDEYDNYLEEIEDKFQKYIKNKINDSDYVNINQNISNINLQKREDELNSIQKKSKSEDPSKKYNSKYEINGDDINMYDDGNTGGLNNHLNQNKFSYKKYNIKNIRMPLYMEKIRIPIVKDLEKKKKAGGYNNEIVYNYLTDYALGGFY
jgi:hypothetical protein